MFTIATQISGFSKYTWTSISVSENVFMSVLSFIIGIRKENKEYVFIKHTHLKKVAFVDIELVRIRFPGKQFIEQ